MKEKVLIVDENDIDTYVDIYFDRSLIVGYYLTDEDHDYGTVSILTNGSSIILKQSDSLKAYLLSKDW